jgi:hypothetical protein
MLIAVFLFGCAGQILPAAETPAPITDIDGQKHPLTGDGVRATVLVFIMHDCPVSNTMAPEIERIRNAYSARGVTVCAVYFENDTTVDDMRQHAKAYGLKMPLVDDCSLQLAERYNATVAPQAIVLDGSAKVVYRGRINNLYEGYGKRRETPTVNDVRDVLDAILRGEEVKLKETAATGCLIDRRKTTEEVAK